MILQTLLVRTSDSYYEKYEKWQELIIQTEDLLKAKFSFLVSLRGRRRLALVDILFTAALKLVFIGYASVTVMFVLIVEWVLFY